MTNRNQKTKKVLLAITFGAIALAFSPSFSLGDQTAGEKAAAETNNVKRDVKKHGHHAKEAVCTGGDAECAAKKGKHRAKEAGETVSDKAKEGADKLDTNNTANH